MYIKRKTFSFVMILHYFLETPPSPPTANHRQRPFQSFTRSEVRGRHRTHSSIPCTCMLFRDFPHLTISYTSVQSFLLFPFYSCIASPCVAEPRLPKTPLGGHLQCFKPFPTSNNTATNSHKHRPFALRQTCR